MTTGLNVGDLVTLDDGFGNHWIDGQVTAFRADGVYVRWPDGKIGIFEYRHAHFLQASTRGEQSNVR
ncbi:MAG TPA: hypothetical protein VGH54_26505 [Mycobacterium sp.]|uniref:hypothetical protein n=1 Tax=Mycobacterium sp. TaxID=1785 RepID=UPI002F41C975